MKIVRTIRNLPGKMKHQLMSALILACLAVTFIVPIFHGGYTIMKTEDIRSSAAVSDVDLLLAASSAFGEARKAMNSTNPDAKEQFIKNVESLVGSGYNWQNMGLLLGPRDALSGSTWNVFQSPTTLSSTEIQNYKSDGLAAAYNKYKAFGHAVELLNADAKKSHSSTASIEEGLDSMSSAALKLGNFGVKFLNDYNPAPVVLAFYDSSNLATYSNNKLVKIVSGNQIMKQIVCLFGDKVGGTGVSFFVLINAVMAIVVFAISLILSLMGNQSVGDGFRKFLMRIVIGTVGIYLIGNLMSIMLKHVSETVLNVDAAESVSYIENNLNLYDWYLTGFTIPTGTELKISKDGQFQFNAEAIRQINKYTYKRLTGKEGNAEDIKKRMENYTQDKNLITASFVTPTYKSLTDEEGEGQAWATDVYYALMENFASNVDLMDGADSESSPLHAYAGKQFSTGMSRYLWMSGLRMSEGNNGTWTCSMLTFSDNYYGINPISAFNMLRTEFSGDNITATSTVYPTLACVAYDAINVKDTTSSNNMNSVLRFIAIFTIIMAALKGMITIFTAGFGGILSGGVKTATGSSYGLGQAIGGVIAIFGGLIGISLILSVTMTLLDAFYGIAMDLLSGSEIIDSILAPIEDAVGDIPLIGDIIMGICAGIVEFLLTLIFSLTFPKLGGIPINVFCQYMADLPGKIAERAQMIEGMLMTGRTSAGHGMPPRPGGGGGGAYGRMASAQAAQGFANAQRQAVGVMAGIGAGVAALGGAGLTAAGKALNKKGDKTEGKPSNPGLDNWDELSPEQQSAAAAAAADAEEDWDEMDQDARQKAMEERMEAEKAEAQAAGDEQADGELSEGEDAAMAEGLDDGSEANVPGEMDSISEESSVAGDAGDAPDGVSDEALDGQSLAGEAGEAGENGEAVPDMNGQSVGDEASGDDNAENINNNQESLHAEQNIGNDIKADADARNVDNSTLTEENEDSGDGTEFAGNTDADGNPVSASGESMNEKDTKAPHGEGTPEGMSANVQNNQTNDMKNNPTANIQAKQIDKSKSSTMNKNTTDGKNKDAGTGNRPKGPDTKGTQTKTGTGQGLNGTSTSAYGKQMSVSDQRKARILHAVGDGLQMAGGNRTIGEGMRDAMGHMKDAAVAYTISDDVLPTLHGSVRDRRRQHQERMRRRNNQSGGVNQ